MTLLPVCTKVSVSPQSGVTSLSVTQVPEDIVLRPLGETPGRVGWETRRYDTGPVDGRRRTRGRVGLLGPGSVPVRRSRRWNGVSVNFGNDVNYGLFGGLCLVYVSGKEILRFLVRSFQIKTSSIYL